MTAPTATFALGVEYDGSAFFGWQRQAHAASVQGALEAALSKVANQPIQVNAAGRTDRGVHATAQVVSLATSATRSERAWRLGGNANLPPSVRIVWATPTQGDFHARFSALSRRYQYLFYEGDASALMVAKACFTQPLDDTQMHVAAQQLRGEHDFTSFRAAGCQSNSPYRRLDAIKVERFGPWVILDIEANAFLLHMVRNVAGALLQVGLGQRDPSWILSLLAAKDRTQLGKTAPPGGLYLVQVRYPEALFPQQVGPWSKLRPPPQLQGRFWRT